MATQQRVTIATMSLASSSNAAPAGDELNSAIVRRLWMITFVAWAIGALLAGWWLIGRFVGHEHARFGAEFDRAFAALTQRLEQNEALLDGLVALLRSSRDPEFPELRDYADETLKRYPHLYTIGYQPRIGLAQREAFEQRMDKRFGQDIAAGGNRPFRIRDFSFAGDRTWRISPARPFYFPVTFMAPALANALDVIGYDVYDDRRFREAIERSSRFDRPVATLPFDLVEGGRGYIYLRALHRRPPTTPNDTADPSADAAAAGSTTAEHLISLLIRADRLFLGTAAPAGGHLSLRHRDSPDGAPAFIGGMGDATPPTAADAWSVALPELHLRRATTSVHQPFELQLTARPQWRDFSWTLAAACLGAWTLLVFGGLAGTLALRRSQQLRQRAQEQTTLARRDLAAADHRAESSRSRSLDELGSGIAHELSQPLTAVLGYSQAALRMLDPAVAPTDELLDRLRETLHANAQQALRAGELMQRLRTLVRRQPVRMQPVVMQEVAANALRLEQARIDEACAMIDLRLPDANVVLQGDAMLLEQLLTNLLRNALAALVSIPPEQRLITIELGVQDGYCRLAVSDNGPGMSAEQLARAFHPFQSTKPSGVGIGLVVCAAIAQAHGGDIRAEPRPGGGASFLITLPLARVTPPHSAEADSTAAPPPEAAP